MRSPTIVERQVGIKLLTPEGSVPGRLHYDPQDPFAVALILQTQDGPVEWVFARDVLIAGLGATVEDPAGLGDITVWSQYIGVRRWMVVRIDSPEGMCEAALSRMSVSAFLDASLRQVRRGNESRLIDWDPVIAQLLEPKARPR